MAELMSTTTFGDPQKDPPPSPLLPGMLVVYYGLDGQLAGGSDDRQHGEVQRCVWDGRAWTILLIDGQQLPLAMIRSVGKTNEAGQVIAAWSVREHGYAQE